MRVHDLLDHWAARIPDEIYATDGRRSVTWAEMRAWTNRAARWLGQELPPGARFGIVSKNSLEILVLYFAASRAGVVPVPLNTRLAPPEWSFILGDAGVDLVIAERELTDAVDGIRDTGAPSRFAVIGGAADGWVSFDDGVAAESSAPVRCELSDDAPFYQVYTSGTTGRPKGAVLSHRAISSNAFQIQTGVRVFRRSAVLVMPLFHAGSALGAFMHTASGITSRIVREFDPGEMVRILRDEHIAMTTMVPAMIQFVLDEADATARSFPDLDVVLYGASPIASDVLRRAIEVFGCGFVQAYGMTETSAVATQLDRADHERALRSDPALLLSCGRPVIGTEVRVVGPDGSDRASGEIGEVLVRGPQLMTGYWNLPEATRDALRGGWMHTGDGGSLDDEGNLFIRDRIKDMIVSGGENVYPREVEEVIFSVEGVTDAAVIGVPDDRWGEVPHAVVVTRTDATVTADDIISRCRGRLAGFKCPKQVEFVAELPRNATGKVLKRELRAPHWEGRARDVG